MPDNETMPDVVALAADMIFASRMRGAAQAVGAPLELARSADALLERARANPPRRILLDLDNRSGDLAQLILTLKSDPRTAAIEVVAYVSHVREDAIAAARDAGADRVLARGAFARQMSDWVRIAE